MPVVPLPLARACMEEYNTLMLGENVQQMHEAFTNTVTFNTKDFATWLDTNKYLENSDSIRICLGVYTPDVARELNAGEIGRITAFICPVVDGIEVDAYNIGENGP
jgi:hypothetical protein